MAEQKKQKERYKIVEVPTETALAFQDLENEETISQLELTKRIANDIELLKKQLIG